MWKWPFETCFGCDNVLFQGCKVIDPNREIVGTWVQPEPQKTTTANKPAATGGGNCKNSPGECMSTTKCRNTGGVSKAGFCPGTPKDIQVYPTSSTTILSSLLANKSTVLQLSEREW